MARQCPPPHQVPIAVSRLSTGGASSLEAPTAADYRHSDVTSADLDSASCIGREDKNHNQRFRAKLISGRDMSP